MGASYRQDPMRWGLMRAPKLGDPTAAVINASESHMAGPLRGGARAARYSEALLLQLGFEGADDSEHL